IERHLNNEPVVACPPSRLYRLRKTVQRNKLAFAAGSAVSASVLIGAIISMVLFFRERTARHEVNEQVAVTSAVNTFLLHDVHGPPWPPLLTPLERGKKQLRASMRP